MNANFGSYEENSMCQPKRLVYVSDFSSAKVIKIAEIQAKKPKKLLMIEKRKRKQIYLVYLNFRSW